jgi:hypothetical protein
MRGPAVLVLCLAAGSAAVWPAAAQAPDPPCAPGVAPSVTIRADDGGGALTATHTIGLLLETAETEIDEFSIALPPGADAVRGGASPAFQTDSPGPVPITATWQHLVLEDASYCTASAATTLNIEPAQPLRYIAPRTHSGVIAGDWRVRIGKEADLRPVQLRVRGVRRARLPSASAPVTTVTFALRGGDKGLTYFGRALRTVRSAGWHFDATWDERDEIRIAMRDHSNRRGRGFGFELELTQAGRRLGRTRVVGRCNDLYCIPRAVK